MIAEIDPPLSVDQQLQHAQQTMHAVHAVARAVLVPRAPRVLYQMIFQALRTVVPFDTGLIAQYDQLQHRMQPIYHVGDGGDGGAPTTWDEQAARFVDWIVEHRQPLTYTHEQRDHVGISFTDAPAAGGEDQRSDAWMGVPLLIEDQLTGLIMLQSEQIAGYTNAHVAVVQAVANPVAVALENARLLTLLETTAHALEIPIIPLTADILVLPLVDMADQARIARTTEVVLDMFQRKGASGLLVDTSGMTEVDPSVVQAITTLMNAIQLMGGQSVIINMRPAFVQALVAGQLHMEAIHTARDVPAGLQLLRRLQQR